MDKETRLPRAVTNVREGFASSLRHGRSLLRRKAWSQMPRWRQITKRTLDIVGSLGLIIVLSPLALIIALLIKGTDGGPVFYFQDRVGKWGKVFRFPKFRSMVMNSDALQKTLEQQNQHGGEGVTFKMKRDPRITWIGRFIRRASIDELPQLWCVLKGDMSLVGPRPALPREVARYSLDDRRRLDVIPGLTCLWQIQGRSEIPFPEQVELDVDYIESQSLVADVKMLAKTVPAVVKGKGAY